MKLKSLDEVRQMSARDRRVYRSLLWYEINKNDPLLKAQREAWAPILRAVETSNEGRAALVVKHGGLTKAIITVEFFEGEHFEDSLVRLTVDRKNGQKPEEYMPLPEELIAYLDRLGLEPYRLPGRWEPV